MIVEEKNKISYVIPAYNSEATLSETVDSIFDTNFEQGDEVIIVNDFSTDNTSSVADELSKKYFPNIKIIKNSENKGCPASRNVGIREAKNDYIFSLDSDNVLSKNSVLELKNKLLEKKADVATFGEARFFVNDINKITHKWIFKRGWFTLEDLFSGHFNPGPLGNYLFTKKSWEKVGGFSELEKGLHEGWIFTFKQLVFKSKIYINNSFYFHRYGHQSLTVREYKKNNIEEQILKSALYKYMDIFDENDQKYIKENTPQWFKLLNKRPVRIKLLNIGKNGKLHRTLYGIYYSIIKILNNL